MTTIDPDKTSTGGEDWRPGMPPIPRDETWWADYELRSREVPTFPTDLDQPENHQE